MPISTVPQSQSGAVKPTTTEVNGSPKQKPTSFTSTIEKGGRFEPEKGRYHLYVSYACPWAHRTLITRKLKGLEDIVSLTVVSPRLDENSWPFASVDPFPGAQVDPINNAERMRDVYLTAEPNYGGRFSVPVLWDKKTSKIVNNESAEIVRILNSAFNDLTEPEKAALDLYPKRLQNEIDEINSWVLSGLNSGVYKTGNAATQSEYESNVKLVFDTLDRLERILSEKDRNYLVGGQLTEADVRLYVTLVRFDVAYHGHFKCNYRMIRSGYPVLHRYMQKLYWTNPAFHETTHFDHIKTLYYWSKTLNPSRIVPVGPIPSIEPLPTPVIAHI